MKRGMSLIELILSIVIMGMVVMTLPLLLLQTQSNVAFSLQQEAILAAKQTLGSILTYQWDMRSYDANASYAYVLDVANGDSELDRNGTNQRVGHINAEGRRKFFLNATQATAIANGNDDINNFNARTRALTVVENDARNLDYLMNLSLTSSVTYVNDAANYNGSTINFTFDPTIAGGITNIKTIAVNVRNNDSNESIITLRAFAYNIGESASAPSRPYQ